MTERLRRLLHFGLLLGMCWASSAWAVNYTLPAASFPPCGNSWNSAQNSCGVRVVLQGGDTVTASTPLTIRADAGFELRGNNTLTGVSLQSDYGRVVVENGGQITGSILSNWGEVMLSGSSVSGSVQGLGAISFINSQVGGAVSANNAITASGSSFSAGVASSNGAVTLTGGSVRGNISSGCCRVTLTNLSVTGNINVSQNDVYLSNTTVTGNITTTNRVELDKSTVYGNVTAATGWGDQTIKGTGNSFIYGVCVPAATTPQKLCTGEPYLLPIHHYRLSYSSQALTCRPHSITVTACSNADCSTTYTSGTSSLSITPGGSPISFTGSTTTTLAIRTAQTVTLGVANASPGASSDLLCRVDGGAASTNCSLTFADSGLLVEAPDLLARETKTLYISAVRKDTSSLECVPAFADVTHSVQLWTRHLDPDPDELIGSPKLFINDLPISSDSASPSVRNLYFHPDGKIRASIRYDDAGQLQLNARYLGSAATQDTGLMMTGHDDFVSRPYGFHIAIKDQSSSCTAATVGGCEALEVNGARLMAGDPFDLNIRAVAWQSDGEPRTEVALRDNPTTPNFQLNGMRLNSLQALPAADRFEYLSPTGTWVPLSSYDHTAGSMTLRVRQREVGIFQLGAAPPAYFGQSIDGGESGLLGRFTPAYLDVAVENAVLLPGCTGSSFTYQEQPMPFSGSARLKLTGMNRQGDPTKNYAHPDFWRFDKSLEHRFFSVTGKPELDRRILQNSAPPDDCTSSDPFAICQAARVTGDSAFELLPYSVLDEGARSYRLAGTLRYLRNPAGPQESDLPFSAQLRLFIGNEQLEDRDGIYYSLDAGVTRAEYLTAGTPDQPLIAGPEVRLGRLQIEDNSAAETQQLDLPYWLQYMSGWNPSATGRDREVWTKNEGDSCSTPLLGDVLLIASSFTGDLSTADFPEPPGTLVPQSGTTQPSGLIRLPAPNKQGSVLVSLSGLGQEGPPKVPPLLPWLLYNWQGGGLEAASGKANFGLQPVQRALIFRREVYR